MSFSIVSITLNSFVIKRYEKGCYIFRKNMNFMIKEVPFMHLLYSICEVMPNAICRFIISPVIAVSRNYVIFYIGVESQDFRVIQIF